MRKGGIVLTVLLATAMAAGAPASGDEPPMVLRAAPNAAVAPASSVGFYQDDRGRVMQVSFDLQQRLWLGVAYAPRKRSIGREELGPAAFDFGLTNQWHSDDGRTRHRVSVMDGEARINPFGLDVTALRYDMSHAYGFPLLRLTKLWWHPSRHDLFLNIGFYGEAGRMQIEPLGDAGNHQLTMASAQATLDLWQSWDLRSYVRLRFGPVVHMRIGPWHEEARLFTGLPETALEGTFILGKRALQQARFRVRGEWLRTLAWAPKPLAQNWLIDGEASYEIILLAINDQPVSLRLAGRVGKRDQDPPALTSVMPVTSSGAGDRRDLEWTATGGLRISFFSPPVARSPRR